MKIFFVNPPFKAEYGKFSRENRSPTVTRSGTLYYPLWLIYAAAVCQKDGFEIEFLDAPATPLNHQESFQFIKKHGKDTKLFVIDTSTPSIFNDIDFGDKLKKLYPEVKVILVGTHPSACPEETLRNAKYIDAVARHEFDYIVRDYARAIRDNTSYEDVKGITYRKGEEIINLNNTLSNSSLCFSQYALEPTNPISSLPHHTTLIVRRGWFSLK
mgnify:CR=1 FL=1